MKIIASQTITNTGLTHIAGEIGVYPGISITGFPPGVSVGLAGRVQTEIERFDAEKLYNRLLSQRRGCEDLTGKDLGGMVLEDGTYKFASSAHLTGTLKIHGDVVIIIGSTLTTAEDALVEVSDGSKVTWLIGSSATLGTGTDFVGDIIAKASITLNTGAKVKGCLTALTGAVTLDTNEVC